VTYAVIATEADGIPRGVRASYAHLGAGLVHAYGLLGVPAELTGAHRGRRGSAACYLAATQADLSLAGAKLSGSAQVWEGGACLQHGSFVLTRDIAREGAVFGLDDEASAALGTDTVTIEQATGRRPEVAEVSAAISGGLSAVLGVHFTAGALTARESALARSLARDSGVGHPRV
jgi:lipoate-protein ligase A